MATPTPAEPKSSRLEQGQHIVKAFLQTMKAKEREVTARLLGYPPHERRQTEREVAVAMRIPLVAVKRHWARAKRLIRESPTIHRALPLLRMQDEPRRTAEDRAIERLDQRRSRVA